MNPDGIIHHPTVLHFGPLPEVTGFGLAVLLSFVISQIICQRELWRRGHDREANAIPDLIIAALVGTLIGAKLYYTILTGESIFSRGGFVFWGGFIGSVLLCYLTIRYKKLNFPRIADVAGLAIAAGYSIGRTGCWAVGDDYGRPWNNAFAVKFPEGAPASTALNMTTQFGVKFPAGTNPASVISVYPTQIFEVVMGFIMFLILWRYRKHTHREGWLFGVYCVLAGTERFIVEFFRAKDDRFIAGLTIAQAIALAVVAVGVVVMTTRSRQMVPVNAG
ncbi:MAG: prolipoprotein diacylglyceryl transferase [Gemmatimonadota bacterium]|nr:prolipoprotein diacylglyceryl transferase [Gemmatimonadota bacterium]